MPVTPLINQADVSTILSRLGPILDYEELGLAINRVMSLVLSSSRGDFFIIDGTSGVDAVARDGKTPATAWNTISYGVSRATAGNGDTLFVLPGSYNEAVTVNVDNLRIIGLDRDSVTGMAFNIQADGVEIAHMRPSKTDTYVIQCQGAYENIYLHDLLFRDLSGFSDSLIFIGTPTVGPINPILRDIEIYNVDNGSGDDLITLIGQVYGGLLERITISGCVADNMIRLHGATPDEPKWNVLKDLSICNNSGSNGMGLFLETDATNTTVQDSVIRGNVIDIRDSGVGNQWINVNGVKLSGTHTVTVAHGTTKQTVTADLDVPRSGQAIVALDTSSLETAGEGGTVVARLEDTSGNVLAKDQYIVGTDEIMLSIVYDMDSGKDKYDITIQVSSAVTADRAVPYEIRYGDG